MSHGTGNELTMCGICGTIGIADEGVVRGMNSALAHRGPDGAGIQLFAGAGSRPPCALGHTRLSIIDTSERGAQPMSDASGRYWITYNGEIYNFRELRTELVRDGHRFRSDSDTEVLVELFARHGANTLERLNGMFAFAVWDSLAGTLFLARDRLGVKPLYYAQSGERLSFASEIKALLPVLSSRRMRRDALADYLTFLWVPDPDTLFDGVMKLPPGHWATFAAGRLTINRWWDMTFAPEQRSESEWSAMVGDAVSAAVSRQRVSDVPLGSFLSGGLDSSAIVAELARNGERPVTYTVGFTPEDLAHDVVTDDVRYSRLLAERLDVEYHEQTLVPQLAELMPKLVWHMDEPVADPAAMTTYLICKAARERLTVILSGMGGDEVFAGYSRHLAARMARFSDVLPRSARTGLRKLLEARMGIGAPGRLRGPRRNLLKLMRGIDLPPHDRYLTYCSYYRPDELSGLLAPDLRIELMGHDPFRRHRDHLSRVSGEHWLNQILYLDMKTFLPCLNLTYTDKMSMAASTEVRVPLLDDELVALSGRIPAGLKLRRTTRKYIFKRSMEDRLPHEVIWRPKAGFTAPIRSWLVGDLRPMVGDLLSPERIRARGLFDPKAVQRLVDDFSAAREDNALRIWTLLTLELWQQEFIDRTAAPESSRAVVA
ncbi:MAG: asparagine synthase (glutamine-hydrolyzing) [Solirubrobacteraceae bacterium]